MSRGGRQQTLFEVYRRSTGAVLGHYSAHSPNQAIRKALRELEMAVPDVPQEKYGACIAEEGVA